MERRRERRIAVELPGTLVAHPRPEQRIWYSQISANGCRITGAGEGLAVGDVVEVGLGPVGASRAAVRWVEPGAIGVQFDEPLHPAIVGYFEAFLVTAA